MKIKTPMKCSLSFLPLLLLLQCCLFACAAGSLNGTPVETIEIRADNVQRDGVPFKIENLSTGDAYWEWQIIDAEDGSIEEISNDFSPNLSLNKGRYDVLVTAKNGDHKITRHFRRYITVLPKVFTAREADEVIDLSKIKADDYIKNYGNKRRPGYKILIKGTYSGRIKITGLKGSKKHPVHIINEGQVEINAANPRMPYAWLWSDDNQYILVDGKADPKIPYGFIVRGHKQKAGQIFFVGGVFSRGFEVCGLNIIGTQGERDGAAAIQVQTTYTPTCNANNWSFEYLHIHNCKIERANTEGMYLGYFTDDVRDTGFAPYRLGQVLVYRDTIVKAGWDGVQITAADVFEVHDNYVEGTGLGGKRNHSSSISWNGGNKAGYCYRNTFTDSQGGASVFFGKTGKEAFMYSNLFVDSYVRNDSAKSVNYSFSKLYNEFADVGLYAFHNTIISERISFKVDYRNSKPDQPIPMIYAANAIVTNLLNKKKYPEIAMGNNLQDSSSWVIQNVWRMRSDRKELKLSDTYRPMEGSPLLNFNFDIQKHIPKLKGGFYDRDGYPLKHEELGYTSGCFSAYQLVKDTTPSTQ